MTLPLVSLLVISYNQQDFIRDALESAVGQDYENLEVLVADDGSTDGTAEIILDYEARYSGRVRALVGGPNLGITGNSNRGLRACRGELWAWMGGDDILDRGKIASQARWMKENPEGVLCGHDVEHWDVEKQRRIRLVSELNPLRTGRGAPAIVRHGVPYGATSVMIRASALPAKGFDDRLRITSDWMLYIDVLASGGSYGYVDGVLARARRHQRNITKTAFQQRFEDAFCTLAIVEASYPHLVRDAGLSRAVYQYEKAKWHLSRGERHAARSYARAAMRPRAAVGWRAWAVFAATYSERLRSSVVAKFRPPL